MVSQSLGFEIVAPSKISSAQILAFLKLNQKWMLSRYQEAINHTSPNALCLWGQAISVNLKFGAKGVSLTQGVLKIGIPHTSHISDIPQHIEKAILGWLKEQARDAISAILKEQVIKLGRGPNGFSIGAQKTRWGSLGTSNRMHINWRLVMAPYAIFEYVVVHELCHLFHRNHSKRFWAKVEKQLPEYRVCEQWLKRHGGGLIRWEIQNMFAV